MDNNEKSVLQRVIDLIEIAHPVPGETVQQKADLRYLEAGLISSFELIQFIVGLEETFEIELAPEDTESDKFRTIGGIAELISEKIASRQ